MSPEGPGFSETVRRAEERLPYPIAMGLKRYRDIHADRHSERVDAALKLLEVTLKLAAALVAKLALLEGAVEGQLRERLRGFASPSLGDWLGLLRDGLRAFDRQDLPVVVRELKAWFDKPVGAEEGVREALVALCASISLKPPDGKLTVARVLDVMVTYRNKGAGHGSRVTDEEYAQRDGCLVTLLSAALGDLRFLSDWPPAYVEDVRMKGGEPYVSLRVGQGREFELRTVKTTEPLQDQRLYCFHFGLDSNPDFALDLSPFVVFRLCPTCRTSQVFFFNAAKRNVEYLSYQCGHFFMADDPSGELGNIEAFLDGRLSLYSLFHGKSLGRDIGPPPVAVSREQRERAEQLVEAVQRLQQRGLFADSLPLVEEALAADPDSGAARVALGIAQLAAGHEPETVLETLTKATEASPNNALAHYALGRCAGLFGRPDVAARALAQAHGLDPSNERYRAWAAAVPPEAAESDARTRDRLAKELLAEAEPLLPELRWWVTALPPWSWIVRRPAVSSLASAVALMLALSIANLPSLDRLWLLRFANVSLLVGLGLYAPFAFARFASALFGRLRPVVTLPFATFRRWFLAELIPVAGTFHVAPPGTPYRMPALWQRERFHLAAFVAGTLLFSGFQTLCALGADPPDGGPGVVVRYASYYLEVWLLAWIPAFVLQALQLIPRFKELPIRHFIDMPDAVSLEPLGTFYLRVAGLGSLAFVLFTAQHYLYRTHLTVPAASLGFIGVVYCLFFAVMFASQGVIVVTMRQLRDRRLTQYASHLEAAFERLMANPTEEHSTALERHRRSMRLLRQGLRLSGFSRTTFTFFLGLSMLQVAVVVGYVYLVSRGVWIR